MPPHALEIETLTAEKLFFTLSDSDGRAGEEEEFPPSDNASKLKRSCENAEHVGEFHKTHRKIPLTVHRAIRPQRWTAPQR